jgi:hypothetical protein
LREGFKLDRTVVGESRVVSTVEVLRVPLQEEIRLPVYSFFQKELLDNNTPVSRERPVDIPPAEQLVCYRNGLPLDERLTRIDELIPPHVIASTPAPQRPRRLQELRTLLQREVLRYFPSQPRHGTESPQLH